MTSTVPSQPVISAPTEVLDFNQHHSAWKLVAGIRPIPLVGAEFDYVDFGQPNTNVQYSSFISNTRVKAKAEALYGMFYLPLPVPLFDLYGKAGIARLQTSANTGGPIVGVGTCTVNNPNCGQGVRIFDGSDTRLAYGVGAQVKVAGLAVRAEYERISSSTGDPDLLSIGLTWTF